jgi:hypothetical protein
MLIAAFIFGSLIIAFSLCFLLHYVKSHQSMRVNQGALARQRERQLKFQAELQARMAIDARKYEEARQALLKQAADNDRDRRDIGHAA